jgi:ribonuclease T2
MNLATPLTINSTRRLPTVLATVVLACVVPTLSGCKSPGPPAPTPRTSSDSASAAGPAPQLASQTRGGHSAGNQPGDFDFYLLNLSWSPEFCYSHPDSPQCPAHPGFVVHGLWPQSTDGTYPQNCSSASGPENPGAFTDIIPTASLVEHEWTTHGTCTGLSADLYFDLIRRAFHEVRIPAAFTAAQAPPRILAPESILEQFAAANPDFPRGSFALSCGNNYLTAIEACMDKDLRPIACEAVRSCRANAVKITPRYFTSR